MCGFILFSSIVILMVRRKLNYVVLILGLVRLSMFLFCLLFGLCFRLGYWLMRLWGLGWGIWSVGFLREALLAVTRICV